MAGHCSFERAALARASKENTMEHSTNSASLSSGDSRSLEKSYDWTIIATAAFIVIGALVANYAVIVSDAVEPNELAAMVAFP
jgi:hypothetical protein